MASTSLSPPSSPPYSKSTTSSISKSPSLSRRSTSSSRPPRPSTSSAAHPGVMPNIPPRTSSLAPPPVPPLPLSPALSVMSANSAAPSNHSNNNSTTSHLGRSNTTKSQSGGNSILGRSKSKSSTTTKQRREKILEIVVDSPHKTLQGIPKVYGTQENPAVIQGRVVLKNSYECKGVEVELEFVAKTVVHWKEHDSNQDSKDHTTHESSLIHTTFSKTFPLPQSKQSNRVDIGTHSFPFRIPISIAFPSTQSSLQDETFYECRAFLLRSTTSSSNTGGGGAGALFFGYGKGITRKDRMALEKMIRIHVQNSFIPATMPGTPIHINEFQGCTAMDLIQYSCYLPSDVIPVQQQGGGGGSEILGTNASHYHQHLAREPSRQSLVVPMEQLQDLAREEEPYLWPVIVRFEPTEQPIRILGAEIYQRMCLNLRVKRRQRRRRRRVISKWESSREGVEDLDEPEQQQEEGGMDEKGARGESKKKRARSGTIASLGSLVAIGGGRSSRSTNASTLANTITTTTSMSPQDKKGRKSFQSTRSEKRLDYYDENNPDRNRKDGNDDDDDEYIEQEEIWHYDDQAKGHLTQIDMAEWEEHQGKKGGFSRTLLINIPKDTAPSLECSLMSRHYRLELIIRVSIGGGEEGQEEKQGEEHELLVKMPVVISPARPPNDRWPTFDLQTFLDNTDDI